jgi:endonuclease YncB( thermonuclease family)
MAIWTVPGTVQRVIDGDTVVMRLDLGWHVARMEESIRIFGINAPEPYTEAGKAAKAYAESLLPVGLAVTVVSLKLLGATDKYGRTLADLQFSNGDSLGDLMIAAGHAAPYLT